MNTYFQTRFSYSESRKELWPIIGRYMQRSIPKESTVLDLACGYGDFTNSIDAKRKIAIDINPESRQYLDKGVEFSAKDIVKDNWESPIENSVDVVFSSNFLEHLDDTEAGIVIGKIKTVLKSGGSFILLQPNYYYMYREYFDDYTHKKIYTHVSLVDFLESHGLQNTHLEKRFLPSSFKKSIFPIWLSKILLKLYFSLPFRIGGQMFLIHKKL